MRQASTSAESVLWEALRAGRLDGLKFRRQHAGGRFVLDFYCAAHRLAVEVDGGVHDRQVERDAARTAQIEAHGCLVLRFRNEEVLETLPGVLDRIRSAVHRSPLPALGEGWRAPASRGEGPPT